MSCAFFTLTIAVVGTSLVMTRCRAEIRTYPLPDDERMRYVLNHGLGMVQTEDTEWGEVKSIYNTK